MSAGVVMVPSRNVLPEVWDSFTASVLEVWLAGKSAATVRAYRADLECFRAFLGGTTPEAALLRLLALRGPEAQAAALQYRGHLVDRGLAAATINRRLAALRSAVRLARLMGQVDWTLELPGVEAQPYRDTRGCGVDGFRAMMRVLDDRVSPKSVRDRAILRLLFDVGLRRGEIVSLDVEHYDPDGRTLAVLGKRRRSRELLTVPGQTKAALDAWLVTGGAEPGPLFRNFDRARKGERLTGHSIARLVRSYGEAAGIGHVRPHGLRHAAITTALDLTGGDVRRVQRFSRHSDLRTLSLYDDSRQDMAGEVAALVASSG